MLSKIALQHLFELPPLCVFQCFQEPFAQYNAKTRWFPLLDFPPLQCTLRFQMLSKVACSKECSKKECSIITLIVMVGGQASTCFFKMHCSQLHTQIANNAKHICWTFLHYSALCVFKCLLKSLAQECSIITLYSGIVV